MNFIEARDGKGFSKSPAYIHYGNQAHSGFQAVNFAALTGCKRIVLVGFDYGHEGKSHFFGDHPNCLRNASDSDYKDMAKAFDRVETDVEIMNATPGSALRRFPMVDLSEALRWDGSMHRHRSVINTGADRLSQA